MKKLAIISILFMAIISSCEKKERKQEPTYLIILSLDGFRWDYTEFANTPTFDSLKEMGVTAESLKPSFPTKTFPNHYTMATGLYPDNHGIVLNGFYDPDLYKHYSLSDRVSIADGSFYGGEPIWVTAEMQNMKAATLFWVGATAEIKNTRPSFWSYYDEELPFESRIDSVYHWLGLPENIRPHLIMTYYHEPDHTGHIHGPESPELICQIEQIDEYLSKLFTSLKRLEHYDKLNFIITSDHGMDAISPDKQIILDYIVDTADLLYWDGWNPNYNLKVEEGKLEKVYNDLMAAQLNYQFWKHGELPERLHYGHHIRTHDITIVPDEGWSMYWSWSNSNSKATHGYDNDNINMHAIFYAVGPAFKTNYIHPTFENIDLYSLFAEILNLEPAETDGKLSNVENMLKK